MIEKTYNLLLRKKVSQKHKTQDCVWMLFVNVAEVFRKMRQFHKMKFCPGRLQLGGKS